MPPSGYSREQIATVQSFLKQCSEALFAEAQDRGLTPSDALSRESADIQAALATAGQQSERPILQLTRDFYCRVAALQPQNADEYVKSVAAVLREIGDELARIHVPAR